MRKLLVGLVMGAGVLLATAATTTVANARSVCDDMGRCHEEYGSGAAARRVDGYGYESYGYEPRYYEPSYAYAPRPYYRSRPGFYVRAPGVSIGIGGW